MRAWWLLVVLALAACVRLAWIFLVPNEQYSDSLWYEGAAASLASTGVYGPDGPSAWFPPGYPFFLAAIYKLAGHSEFAGKLGNVAIGVALAGFTYLLGRLLVSEVVGLLAATAVALWPNLVFHTGILSSDLLAACGFVAALWLGMRPATGPVSGWFRYVLLAAIIGWMVLVRPVSAILLAALGLWWWIDRRSGRHASHRVLLVGLVAGLIVGTWTVRNYVQFGEVIAIATNGGYNFWQSNHRYADGRDVFWPGAPLDDPEYQTMRHGDEFIKNREGYRYAFDYLRTNPGHLLVMLPTKLFWLYHSDTSGFYEGALYPEMEWPSPVVMWISTHERLIESLTFRYYQALALLAAAGAALVIVRMKATWIWPLVAVPVLLTFFHLFFHAKDRYHIPLDGIIAVLAAVTMAEAARLAYSTKR